MADAVDRALYPVWPLRISPLELDFAVETICGTTDPAALRRLLFLLLRAERPRRDD
jgi:hypothetical protein